jgi:hypothetical protein
MEGLHYRQAIANKEFEPTPSVKACQYFPYTDIYYIG